MIILTKNQEASNNQVKTPSEYPSVTELMSVAKAAIDTVMTTPADGFAAIGQICPDRKQGHVNRSEMQKYFRRAIELVAQIKIHDAAAAGAVLEVLETVQAALLKPLTLGTKPPEAEAAAPAQSEAAQTELALEPTPEVHVIKAKKPKA